MMETIRCETEVSTALVTASAAAWMPVCAAAVTVARGVITYVYDG